MASATICCRTCRQDKPQDAFRPQRRECCECQKVRRRQRPGAPFRFLGVTLVHLALQVLCQPGQKWCGRCREAKTRSLFRPGMGAICRRCEGRVSTKRRTVRHRAARPMRVLGRALHDAITAPMRLLGRELVRACREARRSPGAPKNIDRKLRDVIKHRLRNLRRSGRVVTLPGGAFRLCDQFGYSIPQLRSDIERQFTRDMCWQAYLDGRIHIDHRLPAPFFDLTDATETRRFFALPNMQPLWRDANLAKGARRTVLC